MNNDQARELKDGGWRWTRWNDNAKVARAAAPCVTFLEKDAPPAARAGDPVYCPPHKTREEAERHFYDYCLEQVQEGTLADWSGCKVCDAPTKATLGNPGLGKLFYPEPLCDEHRTREQLGLLHPFTPGAILLHS